MSLCVFWTNKSSMRARLLGVRGYASCCWVLHNIWQKLRHGQHSLELRAESLNNNVDSSCWEESERKHEKLPKKILMVRKGLQMQNNCKASSCKDHPTVLVMLIDVSCFLLIILILIVRWSNHHTIHVIHNESIYCILYDYKTHFIFILNSELGHFNSFLVQFNSIHLMISSIT